MSPKMTDFHLIPSSADDGTLRGFLFWEVFRHAEAGPEGPARAAVRRERTAQQQPQPSLQPQLLPQPQLPPQELPPQLPPQQQHRRMIIRMIHRQLPPPIPLLPQHM